jgi:hypothetical protein
MVWKKKEVVPSPPEEPLTPEETTGNSRKL